METLRVSAKSKPNTVAGAIAGVIREQGIVELQTVGAGALNQAVKAIATALNQRVVVVPIEAAALAGTLGGIAEITRSVFGEGAAPRKSAGLPPNVGGGAR